jgi:hypothetical protein
MISIVALEGGDEIVIERDISNLPAVFRDHSPRVMLLSLLVAATGFMSRRSCPFAPAAAPSRPFSQ